jgi:hypothetical protein
VVAAYKTVAAQQPVGAAQQLVAVQQAGSNFNKTVYQKKTTDGSVVLELINAYLINAFNPAGSKAIFPSR